MAPASNKWTSDAERDLAMAVILSHGNIKHDWNAVTELMTSWGYSFTTGSMSQHWTKRILKDFKARRAGDGKGGNGSEEPETPKKPEAAGKAKTPSSGKRKAKKEDENGAESPLKKLKNESD